MHIVVFDRLVMQLGGYCREYDSHVFGILITGKLKQRHWQIQCRAENVSSK